MSSSSFCGQQKWFCIFLLIWWRHSNLPMRLKKISRHIKCYYLMMYLARHNSLHCSTNTTPAHWSTNETHELQKFMCVILRVINALLMKFCFHVWRTNANEFRVGWKHELCHRYENVRTLKIPVLLLTLNSPKPSDIYIYQGPILLTWINLNPSMDRLLHTQYSKLQSILNPNTEIIIQ